jgi:hypothetical protein
LFQTVIQVKADWRNFATCIVACMRAVLVSGRRVMGFEPKKLKIARIRRSLGIRSFSAVSVHAQKTSHADSE